MIDIIKIARDRGFDNKYDYGRWDKVNGRNACNGSMDVDGDGKLDIDCSYFVHKCLQVKYDIIDYMPTAKLNSDQAFKYYEAVPINWVRRGDLIVFNKHVGFVEEIWYDEMFGKWRGRMYHIDSHNDKPFTDDFILDPGSNRPGIRYGDEVPITRFLRPKESCDHYYSRKSTLDHVLQNIGLARFAVVGPAWAWIPIVMDLDGDGVETISIEGEAHFDHDSNGFAEQTGWASAGDGLLAWDRNGDGIINDGKELFNDPIQFPQATNGFQVLSALDDNEDGKIDSNDAVWSSIKVWQDFDEDGYCVPEEVLNPSDLGITAINTNYSNINITDPQGNQHRQAGSFNKSDGSIGTADEVWFKTDKTYTIATEWIDVPEEIAALPDSLGYGNVDDLRQAMVRDTSGQLKTLVENFISQTDPTQRGIILEQIIFKWTGSDGIDPTSRGGNFDARKLAVLEKFFAEPFVGVNGPNPNNIAAPFLNQAYQELFDMFYAELMAETHLKDLYDMITYMWDETTQSLKCDLSAVKAELENRYALDPVSGKTFVEEFARSVKGGHAEERLGLDIIRSNDTFGWFIDSYGYSSKIEGTIASETLIGTASSEAIRGDEGDDTISGKAGNDVLYGQAGNDVLDGGAGSDLLVGGPGNDVLGGAPGLEDHGNFVGWDDIPGNTYEGGLGNDTLRGTQYGDIYKFNLGDGQDVIVETEFHGYSSVYGWTDIVPIGTDVLRFGVGILPSDIQVVRSGNDLIFKHINGTDKLTVSNWYGSGSNQLEKIEFTDGTVWSGADVHAQGLILNGTESDDSLQGVNAFGDTIYGYGGNDTIYGYGGNDTLDGGGGNDTIIGGTGSDTLFAQEGDDILDGQVGADLLVGGPGNDILGGAPGYEDHANWGNNNSGNIYEGGSGNDTLRGTCLGDVYKFNLGDGQDVIVETEFHGYSYAYGWSDFYPTGTDTLQFGSGILPSDISVQRVGTDLVFKH